WYATAEARWPGVDDALWRAAVPVELDGVATLALAPTDLLYNVLSHGFTSFAEHIRWAADAAMIIRGGGIDWERFVALAIARRFVLPVSMQLRWLVTELALDIPAEAMDALTH